MIKFLKELFCKHDWVEVGWSNIGSCFKCDKCPKAYWGRPPKKFRSIDNPSVEPTGNNPSRKIDEPQDSDIKRQRMRVEIRRDIGKKVKPEAEQIDGKIYWFHFGWKMGEEDSYPGEIVWIPKDLRYPHDAPYWLASGDLKPL